MKWKALFVGLLGLLFSAAGIGAVEDVYKEFGSFVLGISLFTEWINENWNLKKYSAMFATWGTGLVFAFVGWGLNLGFLTSAELWEVIVYGIGAAMVANGFWASVVKKILEKLKLIEVRSPIHFPKDDTFDGNKITKNHTKA